MQLDPEFLLLWGQGIPQQDLDGKKNVETMDQPGESDILIYVDEFSWMATKMLVQS